MANLDKKRQKKIGIFDSGLGGLYIGRAIAKLLPDYDYVYLGDTLNVPYGGRSMESIYNLTRSAIDFLIHDQDCDLVVIACNTASVTALRRLQTEYLPENCPDKRILGVVVPTLESATELGATQIGLIATAYTVRSKIYEEEIAKINPQAKLFGQPTPLLVPLIENNGEKYMEMILQDYLNPILEEGLDSLILGCTHYVSIKSHVRELTNHRVRILSQDEIIPPKLADYLKRHPEIEEKLSRGGAMSAFVTDDNPQTIANIQNLLETDIEVKKAKI